jgi:ribosomal protein S27E
MEYLYRCAVCGGELLVNEAVIDVGIGMAKFQNEYHEGFMHKVGCPGCGGDTMDYVHQA